MIKNFQIKGLDFDLISDTHFPINSDINRILDLFLQNKKSEILFILGDIYDSEKGEDSSDSIIYLLNSLSKNYKKILFTPGNHEFRSKKLNDKSSYNGFRESLTENIVIPEGITKPTIETINGVKVLLGNIFYDMEFLDPNLLGLEKENILKVYRDVFPDGKYLFQGNINIFEKMRDGMLEKFDNTIDVVATHCLVHPSLVKFLTLGETGELQKKLGKTIKIEKYHKGHKHHADRINISLEDYIKFYNYKSYFMGSNLLKDSEKIKQGLVCIHGHSHRDSNHFEIIGGKEVKFLSNQYK